MGAGLGRGVVAVDEGHVDEVVRPRTVEEREVTHPGPHAGECGQPVPGHRSAEELLRAHPEVVTLTHAVRHDVLAAGLEGDRRGQRGALPASAGDGGKTVRPRRSPRRDQTEPTWLVLSLAVR